jgi:hypothetical protein
MAEMAKLIADREIPPHKKRRGKHIKKPWKIESRYIGAEVTGRMAKWKVFSRGWRACGSYVNERAMEDAFRSMTTRGGMWGRQNFEYRKAPPPTA